MYIFAYLRASTQEQDAQRAKKRLETFVQEKGHRIASWYIENVSGASLCRFQKTAALNVRSRLHYSSGGVGSIRQRRAAAGQ